MARGWRAATLREETNARVESGRPFCTLRIDRENMMKRLTFNGPFDDFSAVRDCIAHVIAGGDVALKQVSFEALPDRDFFFGGTHALVLEGDGVRVEECVASNEEGNPRDGYGYSMWWTFTGTGARAGGGLHSRVELPSRSSSTSPCR